MYKTVDNSLLSFNIQLNQDMNKVHTLQLVDMSFKTILLYNPSSCCWVSLSHNLFVSESRLLVCQSSLQTRLFSLYPNSICQYILLVFFSSCELVIRCKGLVKLRSNLCHEQVMDDTVDFRQGAHDALSSLWDISGCLACII